MRERRERSPRSRCPVWGREDRLALLSPLIAAVFIFGKLSPPGQLLAEWGWWQESITGTQGRGGGPAVCGAGMAMGHPRPQRSSRCCAAARGSNTGAQQ